MWYACMQELARACRNHSLCACLAGLHHLVHLQGEVSFGGERSSSMNNEQQRQEACSSQQANTVYLAWSGTERETHQEPTWLW